MGGPAQSVHVYGLGTITTTVKFAEVEATLREVLQAGGISSEAAKIAFHEKTNVLVVTGDPAAHALVRQYLEALQKNAGEAAAQNRYETKLNQAAIEAEVRLNAEQNEHRRTEKRLEEMHRELSEAARELDRLKATAPKPH